MYKVNVSYRSLKGFDTVNYEPKHIFTETLVLESCLVAEYHTIIINNTEDAALPNYLTLGTYRALHTIYVYLFPFMLEKPNVRILCFDTHITIELKLPSMRKFERITTCSFPTSTATYLNIETMLYRVFFTHFTRELIAGLSKREWLSLLASHHFNALCHFVGTDSCWETILCTHFVETLIAYTQCMLIANANAGDRLMTLQPYVEAVEWKYNVLQCTSDNTDRTNSLQREQLTMPSLYHVADSEVLEWQRLYDFYVHCLKKVMF